MHLPTSSVIKRVVFMTLLYFWEINHYHTNIMILIITFRSKIYNFLDGASARHTNVHYPSIYWISTLTSYTTIRFGSSAVYPSSSLIPHMRPPRSTPNLQWPFPYRSIRQLEPSIPSTTLLGGTQPLPRIPNSLDRHNVTFWLQPSAASPLSSRSWVWRSPGFASTVASTICP